MFVGGMVLALLAIPAVISAFSSDRPLKGALTLAVTGSALMLAAYATKPEGYRADEIPKVIGSVVGRLLN